MPPRKPQNVSPSQKKMRKLLESRVQTNTMTKYFSPPQVKFEDLIDSPPPVKRARNEQQGVPSSEACSTSTGSGNWSERMGSPLCHKKRRIIGTLSTLSPLSSKNDSPPERPIRNVLGERKNRNLCKVEKPPPCSDSQVGAPDGLTAPKRIKLFEEKFEQPGLAAPEQKLKAVNGFVALMKLSNSSRDMESLCGPSRIQRLANDQSHRGAVSLSETPQPSTSSAFDLSVGAKEVNPISQARFESTRHHQSDFAIADSPMKSTNAKQSRKRVPDRASDESPSPDPVICQRPSNAVCLEKDALVNKRLRKLMEQLESTSTDSRLAHRVVRQSRKQEPKSLSVTSKYEASLDQITSAALVAFHASHKDVETVMELEHGSKLCPNAEWASGNTRRTVDSCYHTNFNFYMRENNELGAIGALRRTGRHHYPHQNDFHAVIHKIILNTRDPVVLYRAQELIYHVLGQHPPCNDTMRTYYWSIIPPLFDDSGPTVRWDTLRSLLEEVANSPGEMSPDSGLNVAPSRPQRSRAILIFFIRLLEEDLRCWVKLSCGRGQLDPSKMLRQRIDVPLVARLLWPKDRIAHFNSSCRELFQLHAVAVKRDETSILAFTKSLVNMMVSVTQLSDLNLPLKLRTPGPQMKALGRDILLSTELSVAQSQAFLVTFRSSELRLLLCTSLLQRLQSPSGLQSLSAFSLKSILLSGLGLAIENSDDEMLSKFLLMPTPVRRCFLTALVAYFKLYGISNTWFVLRDKFKNPSRIPGRRSPEPKGIFSHSYTEDLLVEDLRHAKRLLQDCKELKSVFALLSAA